MKTTGTETRTIEVELPIEAPREAVWKALTEADELKRWFPLDAWSEPGVGGRIELSWGPDMQGALRIRRWEPSARLTTTWMEATERFGEPPPRPADAAPSPFVDDPEAASRLLVDFHLQGRGGSTVLRVAHSGFSRDASWDSEFDAHRRGWNFELRSLKQYLERHRGSEREVVWIRQPVTTDLATAWKKLTGPEGTGKQGSLSGVGPGDRFDLTTVHGDRLAGEAMNHEPPFEFAGTLESLGDGLVRFGVETWSGRTEALFWVSLWDGRARARALAERWRNTLPALVG